MKAVGLGGKTVIRMQDYELHRTIGHSGGQEVGVRRVTLIRCLPAVLHSVVLPLIGSAVVQTENSCKTPTQ